MGRKYSDPAPSSAPSAAAPRTDRAVFVVGSDAGFLKRVFSECRDAPPTTSRFETVNELAESLLGFERISLAFVILVERRGDDLDVPALRLLRLDFPQLQIIAVLDGCDQQSALRLQSLGVQSILLPPFQRINLAREIATALPNVPSFKRHPDLMQRASVRMDFLIPSDLTYVLGINFQISNLLKEFGYPPQDTRVNIPLACDEAITNAIIHGNRSDPTKKVRIQVYVSTNRFRMRVRDEGEGFDVEKLADPTKGENLMRSSGRGVYLMRNIMDSVVFKEGGRAIELEKRNNTEPV